MRELRHLANNIGSGYRQRDERMLALAVSNSLSRRDMATATGLAKSRVDQILRELSAEHDASRSGALSERVKRHDRPS